MADYFLLLDADRFARQLTPPLAESWRQRRFEPLRPLAAALLPEARRYAERYCVGGEPLLAAVDGGLAFDRRLWRTLAGEALLFAAAEIPELRTAEETLLRLLPADGPTVRQVHHGSRDVVFGSAVYRPDLAGLNDPQDVARLTAYLESLRPEAWAAADLVGAEGGDPEDLADELDFARDCLPPLVDVYRRARERGQVMVIEAIY